MGKLIASHNSATGEPGRGLLSWLMTPFARCQSKTIKEQLEAGCTYFDLRIKKYKGEWALGHGPWICKTPLLDILKILSTHNVYVRFGCEEEPPEGFIDYVKDLCKEYNLKLESIYAKPSFHCIYNNETVKMTEKFKAINMDNKRWLFPVPKVYDVSHIYKEDEYWMYDFI